MSKDLILKKQAFLNKIKKGKAVAKPDKDRLKKAAQKTGKNRLLFSLDATASREEAWAVATQITGTMFDSVPDDIEVALAYHGGNYVQEMTGFSKKPKVFADKLHTIKCRAGATDLNGILRRAVDCQGLACIVYIGDCFEEDQEVAEALAKQLKLKGVKLFMFHDRSSEKNGFNVDYAAHVFKTLVDITGGAVMDFNAQAPKKAEELLAAIAVYTVGGQKLLKSQQKRLPVAAKLLKHLD